MLDLLGRRNGVRCFIAKLISPNRISLYKNRGQAIVLVHVQGLFSTSQGRKQKKTAEYVCVHRDNSTITVLNLKVRSSVILSLKQHVLQNFSIISIGREQTLPCIVYRPHLNCRTQKTKVNITRKGKGKENQKRPLNFHKRMLSIGRGHLKK